MTSRLPDCCGHKGNPDCNSTSREAEAMLEAQTKKGAIMNLLRRFTLPMFFILAAFTALLTSCSSPHKKPTPEWQVTQYKLITAPVIGVLPNKDELKLGGFSGLVYLGKSKNLIEMQFLTITDRGPNADLIKKRDSKDMRRPFVSPKFTPQLVFLETNRLDNTLKITQQIALTGPNGKPLTGLPPPHKDANGNHEEPVTGTGEPITPDLLGLDTECIAVDEAGTYWVGEEYRPAIMNFSKSGRLVRMFVPKDYYSESELKEIRKTFGSSAFIRQTLPEAYRSRRVNRGFEGCTVMGNTVIATLQSPLDLKGEPTSLTRWIYLDAKTEKYSEQFYKMDNVKDPRIGDIANLYGKVYAVEQTAKTGPESLHNVYLPIFTRTAKGDPDTVKELVVDLVALGIDQFEKIEGLALISNDEIAVVNDNDFGLTFGDVIGVNNDNVPVISIVKRSTPQDVDEK
jgi:hypothetical protein